jgi:hypothetical protein
LKVNYTEEGVADVVEAITYLKERNPTAAANLRRRERAVHRAPGRQGI